MKVAVSIPDPTFAEADALARRMNITRSKLYAKALDAFVTNSNGEDLTAIANAIADDMEDEDLALLRKSAARNVLHNTEW